MINIVDQMQENILAYFRLFDGLPGITCVDADQVFWLISTCGEPGNQVLRTQLTSEHLDQQIDAILTQIGQYTDHIDWMVFPNCQPADLGVRLEARGMVGGLAGTWMAIDLPVQPNSFPIPARFHMQQVQDYAMLDTWKQISSVGFGTDVQIHTEAYAHGYTKAWVWSSNIGKRVYERVGFVAADFGVREYQWLGVFNAQDKC